MHTNAPNNTRAREKKGEGIIIIKDLKKKMKQVHLNTRNGNKKKYRKILKYSRQILQTKQSE